MATFITLLNQQGTGPRLAVKDVIDVRGVPTTAGCRAVAETAGSAAADAACLAGARAAGAVIVGKANLHELAYGGDGTNEWFGTPVNPLDPDLLPGGSSSGSAVAVAEGAADIGYGTDTAGSIRIPAAFCGLAGLKTTYGRISLTGIWPLAPSLDTVGPLAPDAAGLVAAMGLLEPGFTVNSGPARRLGRIRPPTDDADPRVDAAIDAVLQASDLEVIDVEVTGWTDALAHAHLMIAAEAAAVNAALLASPASDGKISVAVRQRLEEGSTVTAQQLETARAYQRLWTATLSGIFGEVDALALPTVAFFPPPLAAAGRRIYQSQLTAPVNLAGLPALALPVPAEHRLPASLQLVGPAGGEELLLATGAVLEEVTGYRR